MFVIKRMKEGRAYYLKNVTSGFRSYSVSIAEAQKFGKKETAEKIASSLPDVVEVVSLENE